MGLLFDKVGVPGRVGSEFGDFGKSGATGCGLVLPGHGVVPPQSLPVYPRVMREQKREQRRLPPCNPCKHLTIGGEVVSLKPAAPCINQLQKARDLLNKTALPCLIR